MTGGARGPDHGGVETDTVRNQKSPAEILNTVMTSLQMVDTIAVHRGRRNVAEAGAGKLYKMAKQKL